MNKLISLIALVGIASPAFAQIRVLQHDGSTDFTDRAISGTVDGWAHNGYKVDRQGGGIGTGITAWTVLIQDQNCATLENFQFAVFGGLADETTGLPPAVPNPTTDWGMTNTWPDRNNVVGQTALFNSPGGAAAPCAWIYTVTFGTPVDTTAMSDLFTSAFLAAAPTWPSDGPSSHISIAAASPGAATREYPMRSLDAATILEQSTEFGVCWIGDGPTAPGGSSFVPASRQYWINNLVYLHNTRSGVVDNNGGFGPIWGAAGPQNFGMAGSYPDAANITGQAAPQTRNDEVIWSDQHATDFGVGVGIAQVLLSTANIRSLIGAPLVLTGTGLLEVDPTNALFNIGASVPGMQMPITAVGLPEVYLPQIPLTQQPGIAPVLHANNLDIFAQVVRIDLTLGTASLGSLDTHSFRQ